MDRFECTAVTAGCDISEFLQRKATRPSKVYAGKPRIPKPDSSLDNVAKKKAEDVDEWGLVIPSVVLQTGEFSIFRATKFLALC